MTKWLIFCSFIICLSMTLLGLFMDLTYQLHYVPQIEDWQKQLQQSSDLYQKEKTYFDTHVFFSKPNSEGKDFASYLRSKTSTEKNFVLISYDLQKSTLSLGRKWLEKRHLIKPSPLVEEIFNRIGQFSTWSVHKTLALNPKMEPTEFIVAGQIYIANSLYTKPTELIESLNRVRHLAFLLLGSEELNFKLAGLSLLDKEKDLINFINQRKLPLHGQWELISSFELTRYRKFLYQTYKYINYLTPPKLLSQLFVKDSLPIGFCSIYKERKPFMEWIKHFLFSSFPFEPNFDARLKVFRKISKKALRHCDSLKETSIESKIPWKAKLPYYRRLFALKLLLTNKSLGDGS